MRGPNRHGTVLTRRSMYAQTKSLVHSEIVRECKILSIRRVNEGDD